MVDLDEEFARFTAELASVEEAVKSSATADETAATPLVPPPLAPPPVVPPPAAQAPRPSAHSPAAAAPPPPKAPPALQPPPILPPPPAAAPVLPPPPVAAPVLLPPPPPAAGGGGEYGGPPLGGYGGLGYPPPQQQPYMGQPMPGYQQQPPYDQSDPYPPAAAAANPWQHSSSHMAGSSSSGNLAALGSMHHPAAQNPNAPADPETLKRLKEELLQQKQADAKAGGVGGDKAKSKVVLREAAGKRWIDTTLQEWPDNDFRIFVGDLGNEVNDDVLSKAFQRYPSFAKAKIIRNKRTNKSKGFGIVSLLDGNDFAKALKEMNGKYIGNRPCKLSKSTWNERSVKGPVHGGGWSGGKDSKRKDNPVAAAAAAGAGNGSNKVQKTGPKFKYHVPIMRQ